MVERPEELPPDRERRDEGDPLETEDALEHEAEADDSLAPGSMPPRESEDS